jgi:hypothetical protein
MKAIFEKDDKIVGQIETVPKEIEYISKLLDIISKNDDMENPVFTDSYFFICNEYEKIIAEKFGKKHEEVFVAGFKRTDKKDTEIVVFCFVD